MCFVLKKDSRINFCSTIQRRRFVFVCTLSSIKNGKEKEREEEEEE